MSKLFLRGMKDKKGQSTVEFALVLPVLLLIIFGIIEFGFIFNAYVSVAALAREGARYGIVKTRTIEDIKDWVMDAAAGLDKSKLDPKPTREDGKITVTVEYKAAVLDPIMGGILGSEVPIKATVTMAEE